MKLNPNLTIKEFITLADVRQKHKAKADGGAFAICAEARRWLLKLGANKPISLAWDRCSRPFWMAWALVLFQSNHQFTGNKNKDPRYVIHRKLVQIRVDDDRFGFIFSDEINRKKADCIRANFSPFKDEK